MMGSGHTWLGKNKRSIKPASDLKAEGEGRTVEPVGYETEKHAVLQHDPLKCQARSKS